LDIPAPAEEPFFAPKVTEVFGPVVKIFGSKRRLAGEPERIFRKFYRFA
jgi:hypothetical protein